jgi:hypothetical protein
VLRRFTFMALGVATFLAAINPIVDILRPGH